MDHGCGRLEDGKKKRQRVLASDVLPLPLWLTNIVFFCSFWIALFYLLGRWREKIRTSAPFHLLHWGEILAIVVELGSFIYLIGFFGIDYVQQYISKEADSSDEDEEQKRKVFHQRPPRPRISVEGKALVYMEDEALAVSVARGEMPSHLLESELGDCKRAAGVRRRAVELSIGRSLEGMPLDGFDYKAILGACCEMVVGYVQLPVGVAGPLLLDGQEFMVPMATTEGCLVASTNRGCKAIHQSGGATSILLSDGMTRAPVVRFANAQEAFALKTFLEDPAQFPSTAAEFNRSSRFARLQEVKCIQAGRNVFLRFRCSTGDAMGMNMVSKGVNNVLAYLQKGFPHMQVVSISGNFCADKKPTAVNWIEGRGKSVVCEAVISGSVVQKVLKTSVASLVDLNTTKNLVGSAMAGSIGGNNAHAANMVAAVFIATGQDPAQVVESSQCMTQMETVNDGQDLYISVTMPSVEVGTVGGGTILPAQGAALDMLGVKGAEMARPGGNAQQLARVVAGTVLAGELSLMAALAAGHLVKSHLKYNRSSQNLTTTTAAEGESPQQLHRVPSGSALVNQ